MTESHQSVEPGGVGPIVLLLALPIAGMPSLAEPPASDGRGKGVAA